MKRPFGSRHFSAAPALVAASANSALAAAIIQPFFELLFMLRSS
jgi:hypothetical protein